MSRPATHSRVTTEEPVGDELAHQRDGGRAHLARVGAEQLRDGREGSARRQRPVAHADERGAHGVEPDRPTQPATLAQQDHRRVLVTRPPCRSSVTSSAQRHATASTSSSVCSASQVRARSPDRTCGPIGAATGPVASVSSTKGSRSSTRPLQRDDPEPDRTHPARREVVQPRGIHRRELGGRAVVTSVARPGLGVLRGVLDVALDDPRVEAGAGHPAAHPVAPVGVADDLPVAEELRDATGLEVRADRAHEVGDDRVTGLPAVAVLEQRHVGRPWA